ncbi:dual specificity mitogen-activated protein kinase kinase 4 isoform X2 [Homalodisca vitripennis]|uniref:dual specificity mitogen-activated protein kinase kinase 4 isoform X2 n=1 Tax=Homalodisca vitripennis TaxID=197043 RepID=UPI001EEB4D21|nr:dual specificity mitogen-activated protein kinase kinase 4 isoform X2 [Homalodisca vitripennis]
MADQGNSSSQFLPGNKCSRPCLFPKMEFRAPVNEEGDLAAERRRLKKINAQLASNNLTFNDSSSGIKSLPRIAPTEDRVGHSPARARPGIPKVKPLSQDHLFEKSKSGKLERMRLRERLRICQSIQSTGKLQVSPDSVYDFTSEDLQDQGEIGRGAFGTVNKMVHRKSSTVMAVKRIRSTVDEKEQKQLLMDLEVVMKSNECPCIVQFYGALFKEGDCWICMELMDTSLDKLYKYIYEVLQRRIPESILGKITVATVTALNYLKEQLKIIHRDVKPSNILLDRRGNIKLCDFGISGQLVDSIARTRDAGCRPYMAPERIDPQRAKGYDVRSDVWSLGITLMEVATGRFPYPKWNSVFEQLYQVVQGEPPRLSPCDNGNHFSEEFVSFVNTCLIKEELQRPKYNRLLEHPFICRSAESSVDVAQYVSEVLDQMADNGATMFTMNQP